MKKLCVITGSRAEFGLLSRLMGLIERDPDLCLQVVAANMHLSSAFGLTYREIEEAGFTIDRKVHMLLSSDAPNATAKSTALGMMGFADAFEQLKPDALLVLGDRYEILAAVSAALFYRIPVVHLHGGEITEGAYDDAIRHAVTKMSHLHLTATEQYRRRVIQMGESPDRVFAVGALGCDNARHVELMGREELESSLGFALNRNTFLVTYHPVTMEDDTAGDQIRNLLEALGRFDDCRFVFTMPNADTGGRAIEPEIRRFVEEHADRSLFVPSLGMRRYLSALKYVGGVVGNSSSGILEVPSFHIPTLDIGDRQKGRIAAMSVLHAPPVCEEIAAAFSRMREPGFRESLAGVVNPYDKPGTAGEVLRIMKSTRLSAAKTFYDLNPYE